MRGGYHLRALARRWHHPCTHCLLVHKAPAIDCQVIYCFAVTVLSLTVLQSFVYFALTWVHWADSRITEKESDVKNKENGTDGALWKDLFACMIPWEFSTQKMCEVYSDWGSLEQWEICCHTLGVMHSSTMHTGNFHSRNSQAVSRNLSLQICWSMILCQCGELVTIATFPSFCRTRNPFGCLLHGHGCILYQCGWSCLLSFVAFSLLWWNDIRRYTAGFLSFVPDKFPFTNPVPNGVRLDDLDYTVQCKARLSLFAVLTREDVLSREESQRTRPVFMGVLSHCFPASVLSTSTFLFNRPNRVTMHFDMNARTHVQTRHLDSIKFNHILRGRGRLQGGNLIENSASWNRWLCR